MKLLLILFFVAPLLASAQASKTQVSSPGFPVKWESGSWQEIKEKAAAQNKYIFVDCYATWCGPCKLMDKHIYTNDTVSSFLNSNFIPVKVQMDTSKADDESIQKWYSDANTINKEYKVNVYPTFLFISPAGELVHKAQGYHPVKTFTELMADALNPEKQYYTRIANYNRGIKDYSKMADLANTATRLEDGKVARAISQDYINNYLLNLKKSDLFTKEHIDFIKYYISQSDDKGFRFFYKNAKRIDKLMKDSGYVESMAHFIISVEEVSPAISVAAESATNPDWDKLENNIKKKYNSYYSDRIITEAKIRWYQFKKDWPKFSTYTVKYVDKYVLYTDDYELSVRSWQVFLHSMDKEQLEVALEWTQRVMTRNTDSTNILPAIMDTYANLIYKISYLFNDKKDTQKAIQEEEKALSIALRFENKLQIESFQKTVDKMKAGVPTWPQNN